MYKDWLPPSVENRIQFHLKLVNLVRSILPISRINIEVAQFDTHKLKNPDIQGKQYQQGEQAGFWNVREYVLYRDKHKCQNCKGKSKDPVLNVHHLESRQTGGDRPDNLITLCKTCHKLYHRGGFALPKSKKGFREPACLNIMRKKLHERIKALGIPVSEIYGYQTKNRRISNGLAKTHAVDAFVVSGGARQQRLKDSYQFRQVRKQNRKLFKGTRSHIKNKAARVLLGFRQWDKVRYKGQQYFIKGRRTSGYFSLSDIFGSMSMLGGRKLASVKHSSLFLVENASTLLGKGVWHFSRG